MRIVVFILLFVCLVAATNSALAQQQQESFVAAKLSPESLSQLVSPIALYPDALIALILPASTVPSDVVLGARYLVAGRNPALIINQPWDDSVKSLTRYPDVLSWMDQNLEWTSSLGEAFASQSADVMNAIQRLRAQAQTEGNLTDTPQQRVVVEKEYIRIVPVNPEIIYVPQYDPGIVYTQPYSPDEGSLISFGIGLAVGSWLNYDFDWHNRRLYEGDWSGWNNQPNNYGNGNYSSSSTVNNINVVNISNYNAAPWQPSPQSFQQISQRQLNNGGNAGIALAETAALAANPQSAQLAPNALAFNPALRASLVPKPSPISINRIASSVAAKNGANPLALANSQLPFVKKGASTSPSVMSGPVGSAPLVAPVGYSPLKGQLVPGQLAGGQLKAGANPLAPSNSQVPSLNKGTSTTANVQRGVGISAPVDSGIHVPSTPPPVAGQLAGGQLKAGANPLAPGNSQVPSLNKVTSTAASVQKAAGISAPIDSGIRRPSAPPHVLGQLAGDQFNAGSNSALGGTAPGKVPEYHHKSPITTEILNQPTVQQHLKAPIAEKLQVPSQTQNIAPKAYVAPQVLAPAPVQHQAPQVQQPPPQVHQAPPQVQQPPPQAQKVAPGDKKADPKDKKPE